MNLGDLGLHEGLLHALEAREPDTSYPFLEKIVDHVNRKKESVSAQVRMGSGREHLYLVPALQWLLSEEPEGRVLVILPSDQDVATAFGRVASLAEAAGIPVHTLGHDPDPADSSARLSMGAADVLSARQEDGSMDLSGYGFVVVDGLSRFTESPFSGTVRRVNARLRSARERRTILFTDRLGIKEQTLALELSNAPAELYLEEEAEKAKHLPQATWYVAAESKMRLLLGLLGPDLKGSVAVFCNLKESAQDVARRFAANGRRGELILENLPPSRKEDILARARTGEIEAVALTDEGARGLPPGSFRMVINYDIPLEGEPYLERIRLLDAAAPGARIVNFACDRYVYGIPAVEQFMGISLGAVPADESLFAPVDKSAGMAAGRGGRPRDDRSGWRGERSQGRDRNDHPPREGSPNRGPDHRGPGFRPRNEGGFRRDGRDREGDLRNQESIRAGIAELTGVNLGGSGARSRTPDNQPPRDRDVRDRGAPDNGPRPEGTGRGGRRNKRGRRGPPGAGAPRGAGPVSQPSFADPYSLPMEERMRLYKEKYGKHLAENPAPKSPGRKKGRRRRGKPSGTPGAEGAGGPSQAGAASRTDSGGTPSVPNGPSGAADARGPASSMGGEERAGFFGRIFNTPRKEDAPD